MTHKIILPTLLAISVGSLMVGCGGGGGDSVKSNPTPTPIPTDPTPVDPKPTDPTPTPVNKVKVGVIDSGADASSKFLTGQVQKVVNYSESATGEIVAKDITSAGSSEQDMSIRKHGSVVSTIIAGNEVEGSTKGAANGIAEIYAGQVTIDAEGTGSTNVNFSAMAQLQEKYGVNVFNGSFAAEGYLDPRSSAFVDAQKVVDNGGVIILSTGNKGSTDASMESYMPVTQESLEKGFLAVTGMNEDKSGLHEQANACGKAARWCLAADYVNGPVGIEKDGTSGLYYFMGTSGAAPQVTAEIAQVWSKYSWMTAAQVRQAVLTTATYVDDGTGTDQLFNEIYGWGYFNTESALKGPALFSKIFGDNFEATLGADDISTFGNNISGDGGLIKDGAGTLILSGQNTFTGETTVDGGILQVDGKVTSKTTVNNDGTLTGKGQVGSLTNNGTVSTASGALTVNGNYTQSASGKYVYSLGNTLNVTGKADLNGSLQVYAQDQNLITTGDHTVLKVNGGLTGQFADYSSISPFLKISAVSYDTNSVFAKIDYADSKEAGTIKGGVSEVAGSLTNQLMSNANNSMLETGQASKLTEYVAGLQSVTTNEAAQAVLNSNSGALFVEAPSVLLRNESVINNQIARRTHAVTSHAKSGAWGTASYTENRLEADGWNAVDSKTYVTTLGADYAFGNDEKNVIGGYVSNYISKSDFNELDGKNDVDLITLGLYGKWTADTGLYTAANVHYGKGDNKFKRNIFDGENSHQSNVEADMTNLGAYGEIAYPFGRTYLWSLTPYLGLSYNSIDMDDLKESNEYGLSISDSKTEELKGHIGFRFNYQVTHDFTVNAFAEYANAFNRNLADVVIKSNLDESATVTYKSPEFSKDYTFYGVGFDYITPNQQWNVFGDIAGEADNSKNYQLQLGLKYHF
ncbi:autotransporter domain-containing protein [Acinetobacter populi]|uniref:Autotransporter domain-containing protein n=1 Tax=Acinetobacter populi TaxID=1582270 RepID=A0A1Z9Z0U3_9GAMM|nr:autotransporter domain-containing protein [Acinetobacter populi]OUY08069.1 hypothetical protein CAP51_00135 [Acinetobacter populi]